MTVYIVATGAYCENVTDELPLLKNLLRQSVGSSVRRVGRFIQLALIGASRAAVELPSQSAVYLTSGRGDMAATVEVLEAMCRQKQAPRPISFINTVSNAACFYIAQSLALTGPSSFVTSRYFAMEMALKLALLELETRRIDTALVGAVDVVAAPLDEHRQRLELGTSARVAEASHWLQLVREPGARPVLATLELVRQFPDRQALTQWLEKQHFPAVSFLAVGQYLDQNEAEQWQSVTGLSPFIDREDPGHFDSQAGRALCQFIAGGEGTLLYLSGDPHGRYMVMVVSCSEPGQL